MGRLSAVGSAVASGAVSRRRRSRATGLVLISLGGIIAWFFGLGVERGANSQMDFNSFQAPTAHVPLVSIPTRTTALVAASICVALGVWQIAGGSRRRAPLALGVAIACFAFTLLVWAARGTSLNMTGVLSSTLLRSVPITLGALSGVLCERAGVINIAIEAEMLIAAFTSAIVGSATGSVWLGLLGGLVSGGLIGWLLALLSIRYHVDQIIAGFALVIFATGVTSYLAVTVLETRPSLNDAGLLPVIRIPWLAEIPVLGPVLFDNNIFVYSMLLLVVAVHIGLYYTRWGLRVRAVGEHPKAADTVGIDPLRIRYTNVILGGLVAGLGGAYFVLGSVGRFDQNMTGGRGFIALVAVIFGGWNPIPAFAAALVFGFADTLQTTLGVLNAQIPSEFLVMAPYIAVIIVVTALVGRTRAPAADGQLYVKE